ncbi:MAG: alpha-hydroxy acid oxidase [Steroidobacteraceae bacterium]
MTFPGALARCLNIADLRHQARRRAHRASFDYLDGGAEDEVTLHRNSDAYARLELHYRVLRAAAKPDTSVTLLGERLAVPYILSPTACQRLFHTEGELASARAAAEAGTVFCLSTLASTSIETIAAATPGPKWFQFYLWRDRGLAREMIQRAKQAGFKAIILTVDLPTFGNRERDPRNGFTIPPRMGPLQAWHALRSPAWTLDYLTGAPIRYANLAGNAPATTLQAFVGHHFAQGFDWSDAEWMLGEWNGPAIIKGVVRPDDAATAAAAGFRCVMVSNHGGRQLDHSPATIDVAESIIDRVGHEVEVVVDGGIRRGTDVLKALALGATAVGIGRAYLYGLAAGGLPGVRRALEILQAEVTRDMTLLGAADRSNVTRDLLLRR